MRRSELKRKNEEVEPTCLCGCGIRVGFYATTRAGHGQIAGQPRRYARGHNRPPLPLMPRVSANTDVDEGGCWLWKKSTFASGYGQIRVNNQNRLLHRAVYEELVGELPEGVQLHHVCGVRRCCNPAHLLPVTAAQHMLLDDIPARRNALKTHCPHGHAYDTENTYRAKNGQRKCRACQRERGRRKAGRK